MLDAIIEQKEREIAVLKKRHRSAPAGCPDRGILSLKERLLRRPGVIAEIKRKSPSKGWFKRDISVEAIAAGYEAAGAAGISVLTDEIFFGGSAADLQAARSAASCPILRKDFMLDECQIEEARALGADVVLLIAAILTPQRVRELGRAARRLGLEVLLEVHSGAELDAALCDVVDLVGVNSRNLKDFSIDLTLFFELAPRIPSSYPKIAESGLRDPSVVRRLIDAGYNGFLIGESFMRVERPEEACQAFVKELGL